jgi:hypothetical protein
MPEQAPIALFVYNRPLHTRRTLEALSQNRLADESRLVIYADGPQENATDEQLRRIEDVRKIIREKKWCSEVEIIERDTNLGLADSIMTGVTRTISLTGKIIVLEDDLVTSSGFLTYMNKALALYENENKVMHVSGYMLPVKEKLPETFFYNATSCWGWGTWARAWKYFNSDATELWKKLQMSGRMKEYTLDDSNGFDSILQDTISGKNNSWSARWHTSVFLQKGLCLHPNVSLVRNIGHDEFGQHCKDGWWSDVYNKQKIADNILVEPINLIESAVARDAAKQIYLSLGNPTIWMKVKEKLKLLY